MDIQKNTIPENTIDRLLLKKYSNLIKELFETYQYPKYSILWPLKKKKNQKMRFITNISNTNKKVSTDFSKGEKQFLFNFLEKYPESEEALDFVSRWFNCTKTTIIRLMIEKEKI